MIDLPSMKIEDQTPCFEEEKKKKGYRYKIKDRMWKNRNNE